ncbi:MAG: phospholipase D-like domain-containing protein [Limisphaerales bacterium]
MPNTEHSSLYCTWAYRQSLTPALRSQFKDLDHFLRLLCSSANSNLFLVAPYLSAAGLDSLRGSIATSAQKGAWIRLVTGNLDHRNGANRRAIKHLLNGDEGALIQTKLRVLTATERLPALIHAKIILSDQRRGYLGSANLSQSALDHNFELGASLPPAQVRSLHSLLSLLESRGMISDRSSEV